MTRKEIFVKLVMEEFPKNFIKNTYPANPRQSVYTVAMDEVCEPNREFGKEGSVSPEKSYFRHDVILSFLPGGKERKKNSVFDYHYRQVSIETKRNISDLRKDVKILQYLGAVHFCFLAVPEKILQNGVDKIRSFKDSKNLVGLINTDIGDIVIMPDSQEEIQVRERQDRLLANIRSNPKWYDEPEEVYLPHKYYTGQAPDSFVKSDGLLLNIKYKKLLK